ncbi:MAG: SRPBCC domain-containing protein [Planctomycetota bacterium]|nr:SRPBCC domain-containing protein [Planctomycetota bacterium]
MDDFVADAIYIDASPARVFSALLEPQEVVEWMDANEARIAPGVGGEFTVLRNDGSTLAGSIAELIDGKRLRLDDYYFERGAERRGPMFVTFILEPRDEGVWITVRQDGLNTGDGWEDFAHGTRREWVRATVALKRLIEQI